ncbi:MAG: hypothetical protein NVSMB9_10830 [Isosphaeraceae bacterium]
MLNLVTRLTGPLAGPECRRSLGRGWLILVRIAAALAMFGVALLTLWYWWINRRLDPYYQPLWELRLGLILIEGMFVTIALVLGPAVLAGSLAGDRERGTLALLLTSRVNAFEIVLGRLTGKLTQVGMILLAGVPALVLLAALRGSGPGSIFLLLLLPLCVAIGGGGLSVLASILVRRGRDALLLVYLVDLFFLLSPLASAFGLPASAVDWISAFNPFVGSQHLILQGDVEPAWTSIGIWLTLGLAGTALASCRLRSSCLAPLDGERTHRSRGRRWFTPPLGDRPPMLWKERFIERAGTLGRLGRWVGAVLVLAMLASSIGFTAIILWHGQAQGDPRWSDWARDEFGQWVQSSGALLSCLIQWAIGLRAAVSISSERERMTWDALLCSPLEAGEIVRGKLSGSLNALRGLIFAAFLSWLLAAATRAVEMSVVMTWSSEVLLIGCFMAAVGVRTSLACGTATRAMSLTIGIWLGAYVAASFAAALFLAEVILLCNFAWILSSWLGVAPPFAGFWMPLSMKVAWPLSRGAIYLFATLLIVADTILRFDRIAGRMTAGQVALAFEELVHGRPTAPEFLEEEELISSARG